MKYLLTVSIFLNLALGAMLWRGRTDIPRETIKTLEAEQARTQANLDSAYSVIKATHDSLEASYAVFETQRQLAWQAEQERKKIQRKYEAIVFHAFKSDTARYNALKNLYPNEGF